MKKVAKFEKIPESEIVNESEEIKLYYKEMSLPKRATYGSCGYDICSPISFKLQPGETIQIPSLVRCQISDGWFLMIVPRSGLGFKYKLQLNNTVGIIDSDYYHAQNYGHIQIKLTNDGTKTLEIKQGEAVCQGIFLQYGVTEDDDDYEKQRRVGGFGSTTRI